MRLLIVEDEHKIANSLRLGLEQEGFVVDLAFNGNDGYDFAATEEYDLLILDIMLPGISGLEICQKLREAGNHIPIIMLTARGEIENKVEGLNCGADDYMTKPFAFEELLARMHAQLRRPSMLIDNELICDDLVLNTSSYIVRRGNSLLTLSKTEFSLLEFLLKNKDKVVSKDKIIAHVWNYEADILPNTVEVYIGYLRNKVDKPFKKSKQLLKTMRGFGYKISDH